MRSLPLKAVFILSVLVVSCRQYDYRVAKIYVSGLKNKACAEIVHKAVLTELGKSGALHEDEGIDIDLADRTVTVTYNSLKLALKNIEFAIANAGFQANEIPPNPEAVKALPPECTQ